MNKSTFAAGVAVGEDVSTIDHRINELKDCSNEFSQLVADLARRLTPVLEPEQMTDVGLAGDAKAPEQSPVAAQLSCVASGLRNDANYLRSLINRLEI